MEDSQGERRTGLRRRVAMACDFKSSAAAGQGVVTNLSQAGAFVQAADGPPPGALADLTLRWSPGVETRVSAQVVHWIRPTGNSEDASGFGLRFVRGKAGPMQRGRQSAGRKRSGFVIWSAPSQTSSETSL